MSLGRQRLAVQPAGGTVEGRQPAFDRQERLVAKSMHQGADHTGSIALGWYARPPVSTPRRSLFRKPDFAKLWTASVISLFGTQISQLAIPVIAVLLLHAPPFEVALLGTFEFLPFLLFTLPAGVWVDRLPRRRILIGGDLGRAVLLATIPVAYAADVLTIYQLYAVGFGVGIFTVFFDVADQSYLPTVLERDELIDGNGKLQAAYSTAQLLGPPAGGGVVALLTAPFAVVLDALSYLASALLISMIRRAERAADTPAASAPPTEESMASPSGAASIAAEASADASTRPGLRGEVLEGLRFVLGHRYLRNIAATTGSSNLFSNTLYSIYPVFVYVDLSLTPGVVGLLGGAFGAGALLGAFIGGRLGERFGIGTVIVGSIVVGSIGSLAVPIATHDTALGLIGAGGFLAGFGQVAYNVNQVSLRQAITPEPLLGRMNATMRFLVWGAIPIGQVLGGTIATLFGTHAAIWVGAVGGLFAFLPVLLSPVASLQRIPEYEEAGAQA
jgi:MFS family permease